MTDLLTLRIRAPHPTPDAVSARVIALALPGAAATAAQDIFALAGGGIASPNVQDGYYFRIVTDVDAFIWFAASAALCTAPAAATGWPLFASQIQEFWIQPNPTDVIVNYDAFFRVFSAAAGTAKWYLG